MCFATVCCWPVRQARSSMLPACLGVRVARRICSQGVTGLCGRHNNKMSAPYTWLTNTRDTKQGDYFPPPALTYGRSQKKTRFSWQCSHGCLQGDSGDGVAGGFVNDFVQALRLWRFHARFNRNTCSRFRSSLARRSPENGGQMASIELREGRHPEIIRHLNV